MKRTKAKLIVAVLLHDSHDESFLWFSHLTFCPAQARILTFIYNEGSGENGSRKFLLTDSAKDGRRYERRIKPQRGARSQRKERLSLSADFADYADWGKEEPNKKKHS